MQLCQGYGQPYTPQWKGIRGGEKFKLSKSCSPLHQKVSLELHLFTQLCGPRLGSEDEGLEMGASNAHHSPPNCLPLCISENGAIFMVYGMPHEGVGHIAGRHIYIQVLLAVIPSPEYFRW